MRTEAYGDPAMEELAAVPDSDELCRLLVQSPWGWGSSTRHQEAVSLLRGLDGGTLPGSLVALLLCTCRRWDWVTAKLIAAIEDCGVLSGPDLDELAASLLSDEVGVVFPLAWISGQWLESGTADGTTRTVQVSDEAGLRLAFPTARTPRRWAAGRKARWVMKEAAPCGRSNRRRPARPEPGQHPAAEGLQAILRHGRTRHLHDGRAVLRRDLDPQRDAPFVGTQFFFRVLSTRHRWHQRSLPAQRRGWGLGVPRPGCGGGAGQTRPDW